MSLSSDLISQFVKMTNDKTTNRSGSTAYGTVLVNGDLISVKLDGADQSTPAITTADVKNGERVTVLIKDHRAIITGNIDSPAARTGDVKELGNDVIIIDRLLADKASIADLEVERARIDDLESKTITTENLVATNASIENLKAQKLDAETARITYASIDSLKSINAAIYNLEANTADIQTLIFGSATGDVIQTSFANSVIAQLGDAQIKSAMIDSVSASKITAGDIITNNVRVKSNDGRLLISDETLQISDSNRVRVQIGKDAANDYSINVWDQNGNLMFSKGGITDSAIKQAIIRNDMVSDTANIAAHKLDIDSLFDEINGSSKTIKSSRVYLDEEKQTLDVSFKALTSNVSSLSSTVSSQGTAISTIQGQISSKIWQQDITSATDTLSTQYSTLSQSLASFKTTVGNTYATQKDLTSAETKLTQNTDAITAIATKASNNESAIAALELTAEGLTTKVNAAKKQLYHSCSGTSGTTGFVGICSIKINGNYQNRPILFELNNRGRQASNVSLCFKNIDSADPALEHLQYDGGVKVWAYKTADSTWTLIAEKSEGYDTIYVKDFTNNNGNTVVTWTNVHYSSVPTSNITAGTLLAAKLTKTTVDNAAKTATNYLNFSTAGLVIGDMTASTLGKNILIDSDSVDIRSGTSVRASFGETYLYLAKHSKTATIDMCNGLAKLYHAMDGSDSLFVIDTTNYNLSSTKVLSTRWIPLSIETTAANTDNIIVKSIINGVTVGAFGMNSDGYMVRYGSEIAGNVVTTNPPVILDTANFAEMTNSSWVNCTLNSGAFTRYNNDIPQPQVRKIGKQVYLRGEAKPVVAVTPASDSDTVIATIPSGYRPSERQQFIMQGSGAYRWMMSIHTDGRIAISRYTNSTTANMNIAAGAWLCCHAQWLID